MEVDINLIKKAFKKNWYYGRWILVESSVFFTSTQLYLFLIASWIDLSSVAAYNAVQTIINAFNIFLIGVSNYTSTVARTKMLKEGFHAWRKTLFKSAFILSGIFLSGGIILSIFAKKLITIIFTSAYSDFYFLMPIFGLSMFLNGLNSIIGIAFRTAELPKIGFIARSLSAGITIIVSYHLIISWGVLGAAFGLVITQICWLVAYIIAIFRGKTIGREQIEKLRNNHVALTKSF